MSFRLGRVMGIPIRVHFTLWFIFVLIAWSLATGYMPLEYPGLSALTYWLIGVVSACVLFLSVLVHELSHSYVALRNGLPISRITLFFFGGVSEIEQEPESAGVEVKMAAAGPLTSFLIAGVLAGLWYISTLLGSPVPLVATLGYGGVINGALGGFNLLPAFPLDGGRVLRGSLWMRSGSFVKSTVTATKVSEALSMLMMFGGFVLIMFGGFLDGIWIVVMGWFIRSGAEANMRQTLMTEALTGVTAGDIMTEKVEAVQPELALQQLASAIFPAGNQDCYPVTENGEILGSILARDIQKVPVEQQMTLTVRQLMVPYEKSPIVQRTASVNEVMRLMARARVVSVLVADGRTLQGIITRSDLMRTIRDRRRRETGTFGVEAPAVDDQPRCIQCGAPIRSDYAFCNYCGTKQPQAGGCVTKS